MIVRDAKSKIISDKFSVERALNEIITDDEFKDMIWYHTDFCSNPDKYLNTSKVGTVKDWLMEYRNKNNMKDVFHAKEYSARDFEGYTADVLMSSIDLFDDSQIASIETKSELKSLIMDGIKKMYSLT